MMFTTTCLIRMNNSRILITLVFLCISIGITFNTNSNTNDNFHVVSAYSILTTNLNSKYHHMTTTTTTTNSHIGLRRSLQISSISLHSKSYVSNNRHDRYMVLPTISRSRRQRQRRKYTFLLMNTNNNDSSDEESNSNEPFFAISKSSVSSTDSKNDRNVIVSQEESNMKTTTTTTTSSNTQQPKKKIITSSSSTVDDPVLSMADSFVDVFTSVGKLFTNLFQTINTNANTNTNTNDDNNLLQIENESNEEDVSNTAPLQIVSSSTTKNDNDNIAIQSNITSLTNDDNNHNHDVIIQNNESTTNVVVETETISIVENDDTTINYVNGVSYENQYTEEEKDNEEEDDDEDPYHMTTTSNDDIVEYYGTDDDEITNDSTSVGSDAVQQNEGWITTTTSSIDDNDDYGVIVEYDVDELDRWNIPVQSVDSTTNTTNDNDTSGSNNVLLEPITTITMTPSTSDDIDDTEIEEDSDTNTDAGLDADTVTSDLTEQAVSESVSVPDESDPVLEQIDIPVSSEEPLINDEISIPIEPVVQSVVDSKVDETNTNTVDTIAPASDSFSTTLQVDKSTTSPEADTNNNESNMNDVTDTVDEIENDVVFVYDIDELDSWSTGCPNDIVQLDAMTMTLTEVDSEEEDDTDDIDIDESNDEVNEAPLATNTENTEVDDIDSVSIVDDVLSDIENSQSVSPIKDGDSSYDDKPMLEQKHDIKIDFDTLPDLPDDSDDDGSTATAIDEMEWKSAEQLAKSLNQPYESSYYDSSSVDQDTKGLSEISDQSVEVEEEPRVESRGQLDRESYMQSLNQVNQLTTTEIDQPVDTGTQTESLPLKETKVTVDNDIYKPATTTGSSDLSDKWNKMTLNELKDELETFGLPKSGTKAKLIARLMEHAAITSGTNNVVSVPLSSSPSSEADTSANITRDWTNLKVADLKAELSRRGLPTSGKKAELVAILVESDRDLIQNKSNPITNEDVIGTSKEVLNEISITEDKTSDDENIGIVDDDGLENLEELARAAREAVALFEQTNGNIASMDDDVNELVDVDELFDEDVDIDLNDLDLDIIENAAREAALQMQAKVEDEEPSDEALWEIENGIDMELDDSIFVSEDIVNDIAMIAAVDDSTTAVKENEKESSPLPNYSVMAVSQLKEELNRRGLRVTGKKVDLIARLEASDKELP